MKRWIPLVVLVAVAIWWSATRSDRNAVPTSPTEAGEEAVKRSSPSGTEPASAPDTPEDMTKGAEPPTWRPDPNGRPIAGWVVDDTGSPVAGAVVEFIGFSVRMDAPAPPTVRTAEDGGFRLDGLPEGLYFLRARAILHGRDSRPKVPAGRTDVRLVLNRSGRIALSVELPKGEARPEPVRVQVTVERRDESTGALSLAGGGTAEKLESHLDGLSAGHYRVTARLIGVGIGTVKGVPVRQGETTPVSVALAVGEVLEGCVLSDPGGKPVVGALVVAGLLREVPAVLMIADEETAFASLTAPARTDGEGRFRIPGLVPGRYAVGARGKGLQPAAREDVDLPRKSDLVFRLVSGGTLEVRVLDPDAVPIGDAGVSVEFGEDGFASEATGDAGRCRLPVLPAGPVLLTVETPHWTASQSARIVAGEVTRVTVRRPAGGGNVAGRLTRQGKAVVDRYLSFEVRSAGGDPVSLGAQTGPDGKYVLRGIPVGAAELIVYDERRLEILRRPVEIRPGENTLDVELPAGVLRLRVLEEGTGKPLPATHVHFESGRRTWTGGDGRVTVNELEEREHVVQFRAFGHVVVEKRLSPEGDAAETVIRLRPASVLEVILVDPAGRAVPEPAVEVIDAEGRKRTLFLDEWDAGTGGLRLTLEPGTFRLKLAVEGFAPVSTRVILAPEGTRTKVDLTPR